MRWGWRTAAVILALASLGLAPVKAQFLDRQRLIPAELAAQDLAPDIRAPTEAELARIAELEQAVRIEQDCNSTWQTELEVPRRELLALFEATYGPHHPATIRPILSLLCHSYYNARSSPEHLQLIERLRLIGERRQMPVAEYAGRDAESYINGQPMPLADARRKYELARQLFGPASRTAGDSSKQLAQSLDQNQGPGAGYQNMLEWIGIYQQDKSLSPLALAGAYAEMGNYLASQFRADEALQWQGRAFDILEASTGTASKVDLDNIVYFTGQLLGADMGRADALLRQVLARQEALPNSNDKANWNTLATLARTAKFQARYSEAAQYLYRVIVAVGPGPNNQWVREMADLGVSQPEIAPLSVVVFKSLLEENPDDTSLMENLGTAMMFAGQVDEAIPIREQAIALATERYGPTNGETLRLSGNLATHLWMRKSMAAARPVYEQTLAGYRAQLAQIPETASAEQRLGARKWVGTYAGQLLKLYRFDRTNPANGGEPQTLDKAFEVAQLAHPSSSSAAISENAAQMLAQNNGAGELFARWTAAREALGALDAQIALAVQRGDTGDTTRRELAAQRPSLVSRLTGFTDELRDKLPQVLSVLRPEPVSLSELTGSAAHAPLLRADEALVLLYPGMPDAGGEMSRGIVFAVTREGQAWADIALDGTVLVDRIDALRQQLADPDGAGATVTSMRSDPEEFLRFDRMAAHDLYRQLFGDPAIAALLEGKQRWILVPQGPLLSLPFAALVRQPPEGGSAGDIAPASLRKTAWLGQDKVLAVLPSADALRSARMRSFERSGRIEGFFGLGDPAFRGEPDPPMPARQPGQIASTMTPLVPAQQYFRSGTADIAMIGELPRLPNSGPEVQAIARLMGAGQRQVLLQMEASQAGLAARNRNGSLKRAGLVVFATHALLAGELGGTLAEPALALTPQLPGAEALPDPANDGLLTASEVAALELGPSLVVLSACNTAAGDGGGEGFSGLVRAFLLAGARSVVATHYPVLDEASERISTAMVEGLPAASGDTALAMRTAMRSIAADQSRDALGASLAHPRYWAAYVVVDPN